MSATRKNSGNKMKKKQWEKEENWDRDSDKEKEKVRVREGKEAETEKPDIEEITKQTHRVRGKVNRMNCDWNIRVD